MTRIRFRSEAAADLQAIVDWYEEIAPLALPAILTDIGRSLDLLERYPRAGVAVADRPFRRIVTRDYHFKIAYEVVTNEVIVLGIFRYQDREA